MIRDAQCKCYLSVGSSRESMRRPHRSLNGPHVSPIALNTDQFHMHISSNLDFRPDLYRVKVTCRQGLCPHLELPAQDARVQRRARLLWKQPQHVTLPGIGLDLLGSRRKPHCSDISVCMTYCTSFRGTSNVVTENAVDPQNFEPNLALCLEIADLINSKKGNAYVS